MPPSFSIERRTSVRTPIDLAIDVDIRGARLRGRTVNISDAGLSVLLPRPPGGPIGSGERLSFGLALDHVDPDAPMRLDGHGIVVRATDVPDATLLAFRAEWLSTSPVSAVAALPRIV